MCYKFKETKIKRQNEKYTPKKMREKDVGFEKNRKTQNGREIK
jgi:hypothetical protein